jgi:hypothetical protein
MSKIVVLAVIVVLAASEVVYAGLFDSGNPAPAAAKSVSAPAAAAQSVSATNGVSVSPDLLEKMKARLNDTQWTVTVNSMNGQGQAQQDTLTFIDGQMDSQNMEKVGYSASNFSVRIQPDGVTFTWETMKTSKAGTVFWRGDIGSDGIMRGVISDHDIKNGVSNFGFVSTSSKKITPPKTKPAPAQAQAASAKTPASAQTLDSAQPAPTSD